VADTSKYNLNKHKRLSLDKPCFRKNFNKTCNICNKLFSSIQACNNHMNGKCKIIPHIATNLADIETNIESENNNADINSNADNISKAEFYREITKTNNKIGDLLLKLEMISKS
jgi:hypothetical protein